ncbi:hypothetical protein GF371_04035 [Candidatus Woesearchaeota archaeon]|nr:hypothetical protein [Candidatus Woesearchaeota archaeon]
MTHYVIIGCGNAGVTAAETIRKHDKKNKITIVNGENKPFYFRSGLVEFLKKELEEERLLARPKKFFELKRIDVLDGIKVQKVVPETKQIIIDKDNIIKYDKLLIATGAVPKIPEIKGTELRGVKTCRTFIDALDIMELAKHSRHVVVVGGGILGIELADALTKRNNKVTILEKEAKLGTGLMDPCTAIRVLEDLNRRRIDVRLRETVKELRGKEGHVSEVRTTKGKIIKTNLVIFCTGSSPNTSFLSGSGIHTDEGIIVDNNLRTNYSEIYAAGDVAQINDPDSGNHIIRPGWYESANMGETAAMNMIGEDSKYYPAIRYRSTAILGVPYTCIGEISPRVRSRKEYEVLHSNCKKTDDHKLFIIKNNRIVGASFFKDRRCALAVKELVEKGTDVSGVKKQLLDPGFDFDYLLIKQRAEIRNEE